MHLRVGAASIIETRAGGIALRRAGGIALRRVVPKGAARLRFGAPFAAPGRDLWPRGHG